MEFVGRKTLVVDRLAASPKGLTAKRIMNDEC